MREAMEGFGDEISKRVWGWSLPPAVRDAGKRNAGNRKERFQRDYAGFLGRQPNVSLAAKLQFRRRIKNGLFPEQ